MTVGQVVLNLWHVQIGSFLEIWTYLGSEIHALFGTFFSKCHKMETCHQNSTKPVANDGEYPKLFGEKRAVELSPLIKE